MAGEVGVAAEGGVAGGAGEGGVTGGSGVAGEGVGGAAGSSGGPSRELNGCTRYDAQLAPSAARVIVWDGSVPGQPARCMKIRAGQSVEFEGDFIEHPLVAFGGDSPNPVVGQASILFLEPGLFGYLCTIHSGMTGAIWVVP